MEAGTLASDRLLSSSDHDSCLPTDAVPESLNASSQIYLVNRIPFLLILQPGAFLLH